MLDVSTSFKRLQAEKVAADRVLAELTSVESIKEADALRDFLQNMNLKVEVSHSTYPLVRAIIVLIDGPR